MQISCIFFFADQKRCYNWTTPKSIKKIVCDKDLRKCEHVVG
jgi:hypothetical protein